MSDVKKYDVGDTLKNKETGDCYEIVSAPIRAIPTGSFLGFLQVINKKSGINSVLPLGLLGKYDLIKKADHNNCDDYGGSECEQGRKDDSPTINNRCRCIMKPLTEKEIEVGSYWQGAYNDEMVCEVVSKDGYSLTLRDVVANDDERYSYGANQFLFDYKPYAKPATKTDDDELQDILAKGRKHSHYFKDTSAYDEMDIYAICKVWEVESSGCTFAALKKLLNGGERGAKDRMTDLHQAIESIERLIALESMGGDE